MNNVQLPESIENVAQQFPTEEHLEILTLTTQLMSVVDRNKQVTERTPMEKDGVAGVEIYVTNVKVRTGDSKETVESREWYPCGLTDSDEIQQYLRYKEFNQTFEMLKVFLEADDPVINLESGIKAYKEEEAKKQA